VPLSPFFFATGVPRSGVDRRQRRGPDARWSCDPRGHGLERVADGRPPGALLGMFAAAVTFGLGTAGRHAVDRGAGGLDDLASLGRAGRIVLVDVSASSLPG